MNAPVLTTSLVTNPGLDRWIRFQSDRTVRIASGKVEIGQGIVTAIRQIAAEELDVPLDRVAILSGDSDEGPDEAYTSSSLSIEVSGRSVRMVCAEVRQRMLTRLALRLNCSPDEIAVADGAFLQNGEPTGQDYWSIAADVDLTAPVSGTAPMKPVSAYRIVGTSVPRDDLPAKVSGAAFIHDLAFPRMLHARMLRQPSYGARLAALDEAAVRKAAGGAIEIVRVGEFVAFVGDDETVVQAASASAPLHARWDGVRAVTSEMGEARWLVGKPSIDRTLGADSVAVDGTVVEASYSRPYVAHASMAPSCALAEFSDGRLTVISHSQGMHPLRGTLSQALGLPLEAITTRHAHGAGCYGHNGADDAALDAAVVAMQRPGRWVRLQWRREEEFGFEPVSPATLVSLRVVLDEGGRPKDWTTEIWSGTHVQRPLTMGGNLLGREAMPNPPPEPEPQDPSEERGGGGTRNAVPLYDIPAQRTIHHLTRRLPVRTSALRSLGGLPNVFAIESMLDELAERAGEDPVDYRLSILFEPRARRVIETVAASAGWRALRGPAGTGRGVGLGFARYKNRAAYAAVIAEVEVDEEVRFRRVWAAADAGLVINPDGAINQLEGGIIQAASWGLKEQVRLDGTGIASLDWDSYPILKFSEVPEIAAELVGTTENASLGIGECTVGPTAAALGNAVAHALGTRIRDMPLSRERIVAALLQSEAG